MNEGNNIIRKKKQGDHAYSLQAMRPQKLQRQEEVLQRLRLR
jgi:hypothetical protein